MRLVVVGLLVVAAASAATADLRKEIESNDDAATAQPVATPVSVGGRVAAPGDVDLYAVRLEAGQTVKADVLARGFRADNQPGSSLNGVLQIRGTDGTTVLASDQSAGEFDDPFVSWTADASGRYFVAVLDAAGGGGTAHRYVLSIEVDPNGDRATATPIDPPILPSIDALIYPAGDQDYYRFEGRSGDVVTVDVDVAVFNPTNPAAKIVITLFDTAGVQIANASYTDRNADPFLTATLGSDGTHAIRIRELRSYIGTTNTFYQMTVTLGPSAGNDTYGSGTPVLLPRAASGTVAPQGEADHFRFDLAETTTVHADVDAVEGLLSLLDGTANFNGPSGVLASDSSDPDPLLVRSQGTGNYSVGVLGPCTGSGCLAEDSYYVVFLDGDADGDGLYLPADNCPVDSNPEQSDGDRDGVGEACDVCPTVFDPEQRDLDGDGQGDVCEGLCEPPGEVAGDIAFVDDVTFGWTGSAGVTSYEVYRGNLDGGAWAYDHACFESGLIDPLASDVGVPIENLGFYYLVSGRNACGAGTLGAGEQGEERPNSAPCP